MKPRDRGTASQQEPSIRDQTYQAIRSDIVNGVFDMGERLNESSLAARFGISRAPLREALTMLQKDGLLEVVPRVGYVTSRVTPQDVMDIFELRVLLEGAAVRKASASISESDLARLDQLCTQYSQGERHSYRGHLEENLEFHSIIAETAGNRRVAQLLRQMLEQMTRLIILRLDRAHGEEIVAEHMAIASALRQRDAALAQELMVSHLTTAQNATTEAILKLMANWHL